MSKQILIDQYHIDITSTGQLSPDEIKELQLVMYTCRPYIINLITENMRKSTANKLRFKITQ